MSKVLVTGGTGFTGSHLVRRLLDEGAEVRALDTAPGLFADELRSRGAEVVLGSVTDPDAVGEATRGRDEVYHLAAAFRDVSLPQAAYYAVNVEGTRHVVEAALAHGVERFVYCSTQGVHGHIDDPPGDEDSPIEPEDYYQETKYLGEEVCREYLDRGMHLSIVRPTAIYGPGDPGRFVMLFRMAKRGTFLMFGDGRTFYHPVYIDNLVDLFLLAARTPAAHGRAYIGGDAEYATLNELVASVGRAIGTRVRIIHLPFRPMWLASAAVELACKPLGVEPPLFRRRADWFRQVRAFSIDRARDELGYEPRIGLDEGLRRTGAWYLENGYV